MSFQFCVATLKEHDTNKKRKRKNDKRKELHQTRITFVPEEENKQVTDQTFKQKAW